VCLWGVLGEGGVGVCGFFVWGGGGGVCMYVFFVGGGGGGV